MQKDNWSDLSDAQKIDRLRELVKELDAKILTSAGAQVVQVNRRLDALDKRLPPESKVKETR